jgi:polyisoprenoid-binding protein YceI
MLSRFAFAALLVSSAVPGFATTYTIEADHAQGVFRWNHLGFSNPAGQFSQATGTMEFDPDQPTRSSVEVTIPLATLQTGLPELDEVFRSKEFFDTNTFPTATFKSYRIKKGAAADHLDVTGNLNLHGKTQPVTLDVTVVKIGKNPRNGLPEVGFDATTTLRRSAFDLGAYVPQVGDEIPMHIILEAFEAKSYAQYLKDEAAKEAAAKDVKK